MKSGGPSAQSLLQNPCKAGYLTKMGGHGISRNWRKRFFVLDKEDSTLYYFKSQTDELPAGMIYLPQFTHIEKDERKKFCWKLSSRVTPEAISSPVALVGIETIVVDNKETFVPINGKVDPEDGNNEFGDENVDISNRNSGVFPESGDEDDKNNKSVFGRRPSRIYYAYASSEEELDEWINAIRPYLSGCSSSEVPAGSVPVDIGAPPPTPTSVSPVLSETEIKIDTSMPSEDLKKRTDTPVSPAMSTCSIGYKVSSLYTKMADLDSLMSDIESKTKEELKIVHESFKMAYAMLQREINLLKDHTPPPSPTIQ